ncbi:MAG: hypothetical protein V4639_20420 [Pseudomonadota bacterium]
MAGENELFSKMNHNLLASMLYKPEVIGTWYNGKEVKLDGYKFKGCRFDNCKLHVSTTNFVLDSCHIDEQSVIYFGGELIKVIQLFNHKNNWVYVTHPAFAPRKNPDSTISIGV